MNLPPVSQSMHATNEIFNYFFYRVFVHLFVDFCYCLLLASKGTKQSTTVCLGYDTIQSHLIIILISFHLFVATLSSFISVPSLALRLSPPDRYDYAFICIKSECIRKVSLLIGQWAIKSHIICFLVCFFSRFKRMNCSYLQVWHNCAKWTSHVFFSCAHNVWNCVCCFFWVNGVGLLAMNCE